MKAHPESILILGSGGREHAIASRCLKDQTTKNVFVMPGNPGMTHFDDIKLVVGDVLQVESILNVINENNIDLVVIGPEAILERGIADQLREHNIPVVGPGKVGTQLESSKAFSKDFMVKHLVPTAKFEAFKDSTDAIEAINSNRFQSDPVVKASELAAGKGVFVCESKEDAIEAVKNILDHDDFSVSSKEIVIEERLHGRELSAFALFDGDSYQYLGHACDYKRLLDGDHGPNTGGMGTWTPDNFPKEEVVNKINLEVFDRVLNGLKKDKIRFQGVLFAGLMINEQEVNVIEFNVRFGDPETQSLLPLLKGNFSQSLWNCANGILGKSEDQELRMDDTKRAVHIVKVSQNYPAIDGSSMLLGQKIQIDQSLKTTDESIVFFAGVKEINNSLVNSGGRVLGITAIADSSKKACDKAYELIQKINFEGQFYRKDIAKN